MRRTDEENPSNQRTMISTIRLRNRGPGCLNSFIFQIGKVLYEILHLGLLIEHSKNIVVTNIISGLISVPFLIPLFKQKGFVVGYAMIICVYSVGQAFKYMAWRKRQLNGFYIFILFLSATFLIIAAQIILYSLKLIYGALSYYFWVLYFANFGVFIMSHGVSYLLISALYSLLLMGLPVFGFYQYFLDYFMYELVRICRLQNVLEEHIFAPGEKPESCVICFELFMQGDKLIRLSCHPAHIMHTHCIVQWFQIKPICPICRTPI